MFSTNSILIDRLSSRLRTTKTEINKLISELFSSITPYVLNNKVFYMYELGYIYLDKNYNIIFRSSDISFDASLNTITEKYDTVKNRAIKKKLYEMIFENINKTNFSTKKNIEHDFNLLEKQMGRIPLLNDFFERNMIEPSVMLKFRKNYDEILKILRPKLHLGELSKIEKNYLTFLSSIFTPSKRLHEILTLKVLLSKKEITVKDIEEILEEKYLLFEQEKNIENAIEHLSKNIFTSLSIIKEFEPIVEVGEKYSLKKVFKESYKKNGYFKMLIDDLVEYNLNYVLKNYRQKTNETIIKYKEYTKQQAFWNLNLDFNNGYQVSGYTIFEDEKKVVIFITLDDSLQFIAYDNVFYDRQRFTWFSKSNRCLSRNGILTGEGKIANSYYTIEVFLKKKSGEKFYYLGEVERVLSAKEVIGKKGEPLVEYELKLKYEIDIELYSYFNLAPVDTNSIKI